jgi:GTPase SAR1 family protein
MYLITIIGHTGQGKSTFIKKYIANKNVFVYDYQNEYLNLNNSYDARRARYTGKEPEVFIEMCSRKQNTICVFEDASIFFSGRISKEMRNLIYSKRHSGNIYLLVFHSINSVPPKFLETNDYVILFKTLDTELKVKQKCDLLLPSFKKLQLMPNRTSLKIKMI